MPHIGHVGDFDPALESFDSYLERLDEYFIANGIGVPSSKADAAAKQQLGRSLQLLTPSSEKLMRHSVI